LQAANPKYIKILPITTEDSISALAFAFKEPLNKYGKEVLEMAMDSTCGFFNGCAKTVYLTSV
jgi:hypothetical protein